MFIFVAIKWYRSDNESCEGNDTEELDVDFEQLVNQAEDGEDEDWGFPSELKRMVEQEDKEVDAILPRKGIG